MEVDAAFTFGEAPFPHVQKQGAREDETIEGSRTIGIDAIQCSSLVLKE